MEFRHESGPSFKLGKLSRAIDGVLMLFETLMTGKASAEQNMACDEKLLKSLADNSRSVLHFYKWERDSVTYGYFIDPYVYLVKDEIRKRGIQLARRPTGGGIIFHQCDLAFSVVIPASHPAYSLNTLDNYAFVNTAVIDAVSVRQ